jgi:hypothetical protein
MTLGTGRLPGDLVLWILMLLEGCVDVEAPDRVQDAPLQEPSPLGQLTLRNASNAGLVAWMAIRSARAFRDAPRWSDAVVSLTWP